MPPSFRDQCLQSFNVEQRQVYDAASATLQLEYNGSKCFFLNGVGVTGENFVLNTVLAAFRAAGTYSIATASSGIAATLLIELCTVDSGFQYQYYQHQHATLKKHKTVKT